LRIEIHSHRQPPLPPVNPSLVRKQTGLTSRNQFAPKPRTPPTAPRAAAVNKCADEGGVVVGIACEGRRGVGSEEGRGCEAGGRAQRGKGNGGCSGPEAVEDGAEGAVERCVEEEVGGGEALDIGLVL
jgi:hypothetical protein